MQIIDRQSKIDPFDPSGEKPKEIIGDVEFREVHFNYPSRPEVPILRGLNLSIPRGKTVALVGESGCGKSTTIALLEKFYLAEQGAVLLDGRDVSSLNTKWLRENLGLVSQEPQLFATTIAENIRFGKEDATLDGNILYFSFCVIVFFFFSIVSQFIVNCVNFRNNRSR